MNIPLIIRELLLKNEQLVIPGFGTFRVVHQPARIDKTTRLLVPPSKDIVFDGQQRSGDNQLLLSVKKKLGLSEPEAIELLKKFVSALEEDIRSKGTATVKELGRFSAGSSGKIEFKPVDDLLNLGGDFALPRIEIPAPPVREEMKIPAAKARMTVLPVTRTKSRWWIAAVILFLLAGLAALGYYTGVFDRFQAKGKTKEIANDADSQPNRMVFGNRNSAVKDTLKEAVSRQLDERTERKNALGYEEKAREQAVDSTQSVQPKIQKPAHAGPYHIISGSFLVLENAEKQQTTLRAKGLNAELLPRRGKYYMVSLGSYATQEEAATTVEKLRLQLHQDFWVMKISKR